MNAQDSARASAIRPNGIIDMHYDLLMDLYEKREQRDVLRRDYLSDLRAGGISVMAAAIYLEDKYLPEMGLRVALDQIGRLYEEVSRCADFAICKSSTEIDAARAANKIALVITMEGIEPLGSDIHLLRVFYELGVRAIGLTHARRNMAGEGGIFAARGSSPQGITAFGREVVRECERLGIMIDLAHINPAGFDDIMHTLTKPPIVSHTNARKYYDIERNISDDQIRMIGARRGVIGINAVLVSPTRDGATLDGFVDHIEYVTELAGIDSVALGFDFFENIFNAMPQHEREELAAKLTDIHFVPQLTNHSHAQNVVRKLEERGWHADDIRKVLSGNWLRVMREWM